MDRGEAFGALLTSFLDAMSSSAMLVDTEARVLACNQALLDVLGRPFSEIRGTNVLVHFPPQVARIRQARFDECMATGRAVVWEDERAGRTFLNTISPTRGDDGMVVGAAIYAIEITEQRRLEREREALAAKLAQAQKLEAVGRLAGGVAHDFNNLLTGMLMHASMAQAALPDGHRAQESLGVIEVLAERAAALTRQLLTFSRQQEVRPRAIDLREAVERSIGFARRLIGERVAIDVDAGDEPLVVNVDPVQVDQVVLNLLTNARDAMPDGGTVSVHIAGETVAEGESRPPGDYVSLWVKDEGQGIAPDQIDGIFDPFFTTKAVGEGTGLGLSIAFGILSQSGGSLALADTGAGGSTFRASFPRIRSAPQPPETVRGAAHAPTPESGRGRKVLVVEDDEAVRSVASLALRSAGFAVIQVADGAQALARLEQEAVDVMLSDVVMPGLLGTELVERVRARWPSIKTVLMSSYAEPTVRSQAEERSDLLLAKPFSPAELVRAIAGVLDEG